MKTNGEDEHRHLELGTDFAPADPLDRRSFRDWRTVYLQPEAAMWIKREFCYLIAIITMVPMLSLILWFLDPQQFLTAERAHLYFPAQQYALAGLFGALGGAVFSLKHLYHSVAKQKWHLDRRLWRFGTPPVSAVLAFVIVALMSSGFIAVFDKTALDKTSAVVSISFLVGMFSDTAVAKLSELADTLFGASRAGEIHTGGKPTRQPPPIDQ